MGTVWLYDAKRHPLKRFRGCIQHAKTCHYGGGEFSSWGSDCWGGHVSAPRIGSDRGPLALAIASDPWHKQACIPCRLQAFSLTQDLAPDLYGTIWPNPSPDIKPKNPETIFPKSLAQNLSPKSQAQIPVKPYSGNPKPKPRKNTFPHKSPLFLSPKYPVKTQNPNP